MRANSKDRTIGRNYIQKWRFLVREYELVNTICQLSLHHCHEAKARGMATSNSPRHSAHGP